ncbi:hypothetical protein J4219_07650 [Candidatus Woesearchaeota archaeon]|nr:hypothetical protein [Candidatus Woesearchaeota archaeon]
MSLGLTDDDYEYDPTTDERKPNIDLQDILNPTIIWAFAPPHPEFVRAYWFRRDVPVESKYAPEEHSFTFLGFAESKLDYERLCWLTENMHAHFVEEKKNVKGTITLDGIVQKTL